MFGWMNQNKSASIAKDRLTIAIMADRQHLVEFPFMEELKVEIMEVVKKYVCVNNVQIKKEIEGGMEALSIDIELAKS
jgi:cell division topological specificity factor